MKQSEIRVGEFYRAKVSASIVTVRVDKIRKVESTAYRKGGTVYDVTNLATGRSTTFKSAARFRSKAADPNVKKPASKPSEVKNVATAKPKSELAEKLASSKASKTAAPHSVIIARA